MRRVCSRSAAGVAFVVEVAMQMLVQPKAVANTNVARKSNHVASRHASIHIARAVIDQCQAHVRRPNLDDSRRESPVTVLAARPQ
jgi:hypothetical protein